MTIKRYLLFFLIAALTGCATSQPIYNVVASPVPAGPDGQQPAIEEVNKAIFRAATYKRWKPSNLDEDTVQAEITVRNRHEARVTIDYSRQNYSITLVKSFGLDEKNGKIHRNYNKWVQLLDQQIQLELVNETY